LAARDDDRTAVFGPGVPLAVVVSAAVVVGAPLFRSRVRGCCATALAAVTFAGRALAAAVVVVSGSLGRLSATAAVTRAVAPATLGLFAARDCR
jgi:hypothetical protein